jgi:hypothetical protein
MSFLLSRAIGKFKEHLPSSPLQGPASSTPSSCSGGGVNSEGDELVVPLMRRRVSRPTATHPQSSVNGFAKLTPFRAPVLPA